MLHSWSLKQWEIGLGYETCSTNVKAVSYVIMATDSYPGDFVYYMLRFFPRSDSYVFLALPWFDANDMVFEKTSFNPGMIPIIVSLDK